MMTEPSLSGSTTILVLDDEADNNDIVSRALRINSLISVVTCTAPDEALEMLKQQPVQILIVDFKMPGMNGIQFLLKAAQIVPGTTNIILTAFPEQPEIAVGYDRGLVHYILPKPLQPHEIFNVVSTATHLNNLRSSVTRLKEKLSKT